MDLHSDSPYWLLKSGMINTYPSLQKNEKADVVIMGAGITGALVAYHLNKAGFDVVMVDKRHIATGSTSASTALLQYEIDIPMVELTDKVGEKNAVRSYQLCVDAIEKIGHISKAVKDESFELKESFQYASFKSHTPALYKEYQLRLKNGFAVEWLEEKEIAGKFHLSSQAGILSKVGAQADPYRFTHSLLAYLNDKGTRIYDSTDVTEINHHSTSTKLVCDTGYNITAKYLVIACGYESQKYLPQKVEQLRSTYAIISEPSVTKEFWYKNALIWETADPYLYMRTTTGNRILVGGKDDDFSNPVKRQQRQPLKAKALLETFRKLMPGVPFKTDLEWSGVFSTTKDGLPFIGSVKERKNTFFALGFGGNGIVFSLAAAEIITDHLQGKKNADAAIFTFNR